MKKKVLVIVGPTASGKSDLAVKLAKKFRGEIISADSRQVYKGLNIGTGKITKSEMWGVKHHLLDVANPKKQFSIAEYKELASQRLEEINFPIVVGGTGFYIDALTGEVTLPEVPPNPTLRKKLDKKSAEELFKLLSKKDPRRAKMLDPRNKVRLIRALEIVESLGVVPTNNQKAPTHNFIYIGLKPDNLEKRIYERLLKRLPGMIREAKQLHTKGLSYKRMHELGLEYRYLALYLQGKLNKLEMVDKLNKEIQHYSKRQMTWFKRNKEIQWFKPEQYEEILEFVSKKLLL